MIGQSLWLWQPFADDWCQFLSVELALYKIILGGHYVVLGDYYSIYIVYWSHIQIQHSSQLKQDLEISHHLENLWGEEKKRNSPKKENLINGEEDELT